MNIKKEIKIFCKFLTWLNETKHGISNMVVTPFQQEHVAGEIY